MSCSTAYSAARSLERDDEIGALSLGMRGDVLVMDMPTYQYLPYHYGVNHVEVVVKDGKVVVEDGKRVN